MTNLFSGKDEGPWFVEYYPELIVNYDVYAYVPLAGLESTCLLVLLTEVCIKSSFAEVSKLDITSLLKLKSMNQKLTFFY